MMSDIEARHLYLKLIFFTRPSQRSCSSGAARPKTKEVSTPPVVETVAVAGMMCPSIRNGRPPRM